MNKSWQKIVIGVLFAGVLVAPASAQRRTGPENGLIGIRLFDSSTRILRMFGNPDQIQPVFVGGAQQPGGAPGGGRAGGFPGFGGPGGPPGFPGAGGGGRGGGPAGPSMDASDFDSAEEISQARPGGVGGASGPPQGFGGPPPGMGGPPGGFPGTGGLGGPPGGFPGGGPPRMGGAGGFPGAPGGGRGGAPNIAGGQADRVTFTRWVYLRKGTQFAFVIDRMGRVLQVEAIGMKNQNVRTRRGVSFGNTFATIIQRYGTPDGYEIAGETITMKYLTRQKVSFRLSRLAPQRPHVVTGILVAAGKS